MIKLKVSDTQDYFEADGKKFFYFADTVWMAFANIPTDEWVEYLEYRRMQGFNVLQISVLPVLHDTGESGVNIHPFELDSNGKFDFFHLNSEYFERAAKMLDMAVKQGFIPALVPLWCTYVKDTWASGFIPGSIMPIDAVKPYIEYIIKMFSEYNPIYLVSGDTRFETEDVYNYHRIILETVKRYDPDALTAMHLTTDTNLPEEFVNSSLDFYMFQTGHRAEKQDVYTWGKTFSEKSVKRPVVNGEPCYEGHGFVDKFGKFQEFDIRKATWQSLLSGAKAGITYGAHGIWSWHKKGCEFMNVKVSGMPYDCRIALRLKGAWDVAFAKWIFDTYDLFDIEPVECIENDTQEIRMSMSKDSSKIVIYSPYNMDIKVNMDLTGYKWSVIGLSDKLFGKPVVKNNSGLWTIEMSNFNSDILVLGTKL
jgi:hypothetical protein